MEKGMDRTSKRTTRQGENMTALVSAFARGEHARRGEEEAVPRPGRPTVAHVFYDPVAQAILSPEEKARIGDSMAEGICFFQPDFAGEAREALDSIVDGHLAPATLGRNAFCEAALEAAVGTGARQYLLLGAGYDSFAYRQRDWAKPLTIFELDLPVMGADKRRRMADIAPQPENLHYIAADLQEEGWPAALAAHPAFHREAPTFVSLLGVAHYLPRETLRALLAALAALLPRGSALAFDYPDYSQEKPGPSSSIPASSAGKQRRLIAEAAAAPPSAYGFYEMEKLLEEEGALAYEHLTPEEIEARFFQPYNLSHPRQPMAPTECNNYCLAVLWSK